MDGAKMAVKVVVAAGLAFVWPGPAVVDWVERRNAPGATGDPVPAQPVSPAAASAQRAAAAQAMATADERMASAARWLAGAKPDCNAVEASSRVAHTPPPPGWEGDAHAAACLALAGRIDDARAWIEPLDSEERWQAVGIVFEAGHPAADAGDEVAAGPLMELVVEFWPNHYMALYHAGAAAYERDEHEKASEYLDRFLVHYEPHDAWRERALAMLAEMDPDG